MRFRVQQFCLKMMAYTYSIEYTPGKHLVLADALSRSPVEEKVVTRGEMRDSNIVLEILLDPPRATDRLSRIRAAILEDELGLLLSKYIHKASPPQEVKDTPAIRTNNSYQLLAMEKTERPKAMLLSS